MKTIIPLFFMLSCMSILHAQESQLQQLNLADQASQVKNTHKVNTEAVLLQMLQQTNGTQILQFGNENVAVVEGEQMKATQIGDYQHLYHNKNSTLVPSNMQVTMEGINNVVEIQGNNSIVENMTINLRGDNRTVIIRSY